MAHIEQLTELEIATQQVDGLLRRFPLLIDPGELRTPEQIRQDMIVARIPKQELGGLPLALTIEHSQQTEV